MSEYLCQNGMSKSWCSHVLHWPENEIYMLVPKHRILWEFDLHVLRSVKAVQLQRWWWLSLRYLSDVLVETVNTEICRKFRTVCMNILLEKAHWILFLHTNSTFVKNVNCFHIAQTMKNRQLSSSNVPNNSAVPPRTTEQPVVAEYNDSLILTRSVKKMHINAMAIFYLWMAIMVATSHCLILYKSQQRTNAVRWASLWFTPILVPLSGLKLENLSLLILAPFCRHRHSENQDPPE